VWLVGWVMIRYLNEANDGMGTMLDYEVVVIIIIITKGEIYLYLM
jgi:hypothetical protein